MFSKCEGRDEPVTCGREGCRKEKLQYKGSETSGSWAGLRVAEGVYCVHSQDVPNDRKNDGEGESPTEGGCGV